MWHVWAVLSCSVMSDSFWPHGLLPARLLCPWGFSRQEYWSELSCSPPGDLPNPGIKPRSSSLQADTLLSEPPGKPQQHTLNICPPLTWSFPDISVGKESACNAGDSGSIPGLGRSPGERRGYSLQYFGASLVAQLVQNLPAVRKTWVWSLGWEDPLEKG